MSVASCFVGRKMASLKVASYLWNSHLSPLNAFALSRTF